MLDYVFEISVPVIFMGNQQVSPRIVRLSWGQIEVEGGIRFRDAKLYPGGSWEWDWRETGTQHSPGILPADVEELLHRVPNG